MKNKTALIILDGFGINTLTPQENSIYQAKTSTFDRLFAQLHTKLDASGLEVGIPQGQMGNSEVGHMTIGSGKIIQQSLVKINELFSKNKFAQIPTFQSGIDHVIKHSSVLHIMTLFGHGGVHSHHDHLMEILKIIPQNIPISFHLFGDGRDIEPTSLLELWKDFDQKILQKYSNITLSSISGRYFAMDRDNNWERIQKAYDTMVFSKNPTHLSPIEYIQNQYSQNINDEFIEPAFFIGGKNIQDNDSIFFLNFRSDRAKQITQVFCQNDFSYFKRKECKNLFFASMTKYYKEYTQNYFVEDEKLTNVLGEVLEKNHFTQLHIAETEKFAHVTKFFNGGNQIVFQGEKDILVPSHKVATYDQDPEMSAGEIWQEFQKNAKDFDFCVVNFANGDMVGHTGNMKACIQAIEKLDTIIGEMIDFCHLSDIHLCITADHGNCEEMGNSKNPKTSHTINQVPFWYIVNKKIIPTQKDGGLSNIASTLLDILGIKKPENMDKSLLISSNHS